MARNEFIERFRIETPARYRIRIRGRIDPGWADRLAGMAIQSGTAGGPRVTTLTGNLQDQAALSGVLNTLYELHLPLLSVENLDEPGRPDPEPR